MYQYSILIFESSHQTFFCWEAWMVRHKTICCLNQHHFLQGGSMVNPIYGGLQNFTRNFCIKMI